jgi:hypothetical protein
VLASSSGAFVAIYVVFVIALVILEIAGLWKVFTKANQPGWAAIVPFFNYYVLLKVVGRPGWWLILYFIPFVNIVIAIIVLWELAKSFNKSAGWFWGLLLLTFIFMPMLGFGSSTYAGPVAANR